MFQGSTGLNLDAKGRLAVPTRHRDLLQADADKKLVLTAHPDGCLLLYPASAWAPIGKKIMDFPGFDSKLGLWKRLLVGYAEDMELDGAGRLLISPTLRKYASLEKQIMFVGQGTHFELWNEAIWHAKLDQIATEPGQLPPSLESLAL